MPRPDLHRGAEERSQSHGVGPTSASDASRAQAVPHGSPLSYQQGCRTRAACPQWSSSEYLTCAEAAVARRRDWQVAQLPIGIPIPRSDMGALEILQSWRRRAAHGTLWGYRRGCRDRSKCPNARFGLETCTDARRTYFREYERRRTTGAGTRLEHGTVKAYHAGCRDPLTCPGDAAGLTCVEARRRHRRASARHLPNSKGPLVDALPAVVRVQEMLASGRSARAIAQETGVGRTTIDKIAGCSDDAKIYTSTRDAILRVGRDRDAEAWQTKRSSGPRQL